MANSERIHQVESKEVIQVNLGEPFFLPPVDPSFFEKDYPSLSVVQSFPLEIENLGRGEVRIMRDKDVLDFSFLSIRYKTPAGPVAPLLVEVSIYNLPEGKLKTIKSTLLFDGQPFAGDPSYDDIELQQKGKAELMFHVWIDSQTQEVCEVYFPPNPEVFKRIRFVIEDIAR